MDPELYRALVSGNITYFESLSNADMHRLPQVTSDQQNTILHIVAKCGKEQIAEKIISSCQSLVHETNLKDDSPLHIAARLGHLGMAKLLINQAKLTEEVEAEKNLLKMVNLKGDTALHEAVKNRHIEVVNLLIAEDQQLTTVTNSAGESPLFIAADRKFYEIGLHILNSSPICSYKGRNGMNVLHAAVIRAEKTSRLEDLLGLLLLLNDSRFSSPMKLFKFCLRFLQLFKLSFIWRWIFPDDRYINFMCQVVKRNSSIISEADKFGWTPLHYAASLGNSRVVELLLEFDISIANVKDEEGMSALHIAAKARQDDVILKLIEKCPHITELLDNKGRTALHYAVERGMRSTIDIFLSHPVFGDLINAQDADGNTPFPFAALQERKKILNHLARDARIDEWAINKEGFTPFDIAKSKNLLLPQGIKSLECSISRKIREVKSAGIHRQGLSLQTENLYQEPKEKDMKLDTATKRKADAYKFKQASNIISLIATIIASVTFAAAITMPGGYNSDSKEHAGMAILSRKSVFAVFVIANTLAFVSSASLMILPFWTLKQTKVSPTKALAWCTAALALSVFSMIIAFLAGTYVVLGTSSGLAIAAIIVGVVSFYVIFIPIERVML